MGNLGDWRRQAEGFKELLGFGGVKCDDPFFQHIQHLFGTQTPERAWRPASAEQQQMRVGRKRIQKKREKILEPRGVENVMNVVQDYKRGPETRSDVRLGKSIYEKTGNIRLRNLLVVHARAICIGRAKNILGQTC